MEAATRASNSRRTCGQVRVWIDLTNSPHVLVMRPVIEALRRARRRGARDRARLRADARAARALPARPHRDRPPPRRQAGGQGRSGWPRARARSCAGRAGARSTSRSATAPTTSRSRPSCCGSRRSTAFDYEWARQQHQINCRLAARRRRAGRDPARAAGARTARRRTSCAATRGSRRSTTWRTSSPTPRCSTSSASTATKPLAVVRTPPAVSLYHRFEAPVFTEVLERLRGEQVVVLPRTDEQRAELAGGRLHRPRAGDRRAVADRVRRPDDLRRRHDEPRGGRARHAGVDDVRGPARRGRRGADRRRPDAPADERRRRRVRAPRAAGNRPHRASAATPRSSPTSS